MVITDALIYTSTWSTIKNIIVASAPYTTNSTQTTTKSAGVYASYNDKNFKMPGIIINPASVSEGEYKFGTNIGKRYINFSVECYYKNTLGTDQLAEQIVHAISQSNIMGMELESFDSDQAFVDQNTNKFQLKTVTFNFTRE